MTRGGNKNKESRERMVNKYRVCHKVGEGSFGEVFKVVHTETNLTYAMKVRDTGNALQRFSCSRRFPSSPSQKRGMLRL